MIVRNFVEKEKYYDSVFLMRMAKDIAAMDGIGNISVGMGTPLNKDTIEELGLMLDAGRQATPNDLIIALSAEDDTTAEAARDTFLKLLMSKNTAGASQDFRSLDTLVRTVKDRNLAVISLAGQYAGEEAEKALKAGMNVFMFSDNVPLKQEIQLKNLAKEKGLLMMGPDCGLSFINGVAIGLCSKVRRGPIGIAAASGSGMQEVMNIIHKNGMGISHAIGVGGRDLREEVGGITMLQSIEILENDPETKVIVLISKPPAKATAEKIFAALANCSKPVVVQFINSDAVFPDHKDWYCSDSFENTATIAMALAKGEPVKTISEKEYYEKFEEEAARIAAGFTGGQRYLRGIYCGGSLAEEVLTLAQEKLGPLYGNIAFSEEYILDNPFESYKDCLIDIGAEEFTVGKPHVAIDPVPRLARFEKEARDPETAVILLDFLLGYSLCEDPAGMMAETIADGIRHAQEENRQLCVVASVCGSDLDPQELKKQEKILQDAGVIVLENNGAAARFAIAVIQKRRELLKQ